MSSFEILPLKDVAGFTAVLQAQGRQRGHPGRRAIQARPSSTSTPVMEDGGALRRRLRSQVEVPALSKRRDSIDDRGHRQLGLGRRARDVHAAGLCTPYPQDGPLRTREHLGTSGYHEPAGRPRRQVDPGGRRWATIGSRTVKRCVAFEMDVSVLDPEHFRGRHQESRRRQVTNLKAILPKYDSCRCIAPSPPQTIDMFDAETISA